ncbi:hypothetical protein CTAYLR_009089 [Chrysophaeum taylorii]|uniref:EF-hand domain-containing protein n=1 Tax=Chrysophaeum taylorii TaxID=2483200 RepID=A0AAD7XPR6_9STRA|nr:hypothetical protein CTAYLR_009089 [Chrysophaeum taylorii]
MNSEEKLAKVVVGKLVERGGSLRLVTKRCFQRFDVDGSGSLAIEDVARCLEDLLPGVDKSDVQRLAERLGGDVSQIADTLETLHATGGGGLPAASRPDSSFEHRLEVLLAKVSARVATLATEAHARLPASRRLPARKNQLIRELGLREIRNAFSQDRLTPAQMGAALDRFRPPGQPALLATSADIARLWEMCDHGDPEAFVRLFHDVDFGGHHCDKPGEVRLRYKQSRTLAAPPAGWRRRELARAVGRSFRLPKKGLEIEHVFGYSSLSGPNLMASGERIVYAAAGVAVVQQRRGCQQQQHYFRGHDDDVACIAVDAEGLLGATGQVQSGDAAPYACVWSVTDGLELRRFSGDFQRLVCCLCFFRDASHLCAVSGDDRHTLYVYDLRNLESNKPVIAAPCKSGVKPPAVTVLAAAPERVCARLGVQHLIVSAGIGHLAFWRIEDEMPRFVRRLPTYGARRAPDATRCVGFLDDAVATGGSDGRVYVWRDAAISLTFQAHKGPCRAIVFNNNNNNNQRRMLLFTGGADGVIRCWARDGANKKKYELVAAHRPSSPHAPTKQDQDQDQDQDDEWPAEKTLEPPPPPRPHVMKKLQAYQRAAVLQKVAKKEQWSTFESLRRTGDRGVVDLAIYPDGRVVAGLGFGTIARVDVEKKRETIIQRSHHATTSDIEAHPVDPNVCATVGLDCLLCVWNVETRELVESASLPAPGSSVAIRAGIQTLPDHYAVGLGTGAINLRAADDVKCSVLERSVSRQPIQKVRYDKTGRLLAVGSHDTTIYLLDASTPDYSLLRRFKGHSSTVMHLDFSEDSKVLQSSCAGYEILYWDLERGRMLTHDNVDSETRWHTWTLTLGFPVMGIFKKDSDGTDVNVAHRSNDLIVTGDDSGYVNLYNAPVVCRHAAHIQYSGHSSHCVGARFLKDSRRIVTTGGRDASVFVWRLVDRSSSNVSPPGEMALVPPAPRPAWIAGCDLTSDDRTITSPQKHRKTPEAWT